MVAGGSRRFGEKLRVLRTAQGLSLKELGHKLGYVSHGYLSEVENGKKQPSIDLVLFVARYFDISIDSLLRDDLELTKRGNEY